MPFTLRYLRANGKGGNSPANTGLVVVSGPAMTVKCAPCCLHPLRGPGRDAATPPEISSLERWQSGRMRRIRNPVYGFAVTWVRIPPSPPRNANGPFSGPFAFPGDGLVDEPTGSTHRQDSRCAQRSCPAGARYMDVPSASHPLRQEMQTAPFGAVCISRGRVGGLTHRFDTSAGQPMCTAQLRPAVIPRMRDPSYRVLARSKWIPAFAGMTTIRESHPRLAAPRQ